MTLGSKQDLIDLIARGSCDTPPRNESAQAGWKEPASRSELISELKACRTISELENTLRGKKPSPEEHAVSVRVASVLEAQRVKANLGVVFNFDWHDLYAPENANVAQHCILEWVWRLAKNANPKRDRNGDDIRFVAVPEIWGTDMQPRPLHYHMALRLDHTLTASQIIPIGQRLWHQLLKQNKYGGPAASVHIESCTNNDSLSRYNLKQANIDWVFQRTLTTSDLVRYRS